MRRQLRPATIEDVPAIQEVGRGAWRQTYTPLVSTAFVDAGLEQWWSVERLTGAIADPKTITHVAVADGVVGGIAQLGFHTPPEAYLWKFYLHPDIQGKGFGVELLATVLALLPREVTRVNADVLTGNDRAMRFYLRYGFVHTGDTVMHELGHVVPIMQIRYDLEQGNNAARAVS